MLAASAAAPKPTPSLLQPLVTAGDAAAAWGCVRPKKAGGTAGVVGLGRGAATAFQNQRRFSGSWAAASSALWPVSSLSLSTSPSTSSRSLSSSYSSWSSSHRFGIRRYVCLLLLFQLVPLLFSSSYHSIHSMPSVIPSIPNPFVHSPIKKANAQLLSGVSSSSSLNNHKPYLHLFTPPSSFCFHPLIGSSRRCILLAKSLILVG